MYVSFKGVLYLLVSTIYLLVCNGCINNTECGDYPLTAEVRDCMVNTVDAMVHEHYPFVEQKELDLGDFSSELQGLLTMELDDYHFVVELARTIAKLKDGHTRLERFLLGAESGTAPIDYRLVDGRVLIAAVFDEGLGVKAGDEILTIEGKRAIEYLTLQAALHTVDFSKLTQMQGPTRLLDGPADSLLTLKTARAGEVQMRRRFHLPKPTSERIGDIGYINVSTFGFIDDLDRLDEALNGLMDTSGLIIDLRNNGGGYPSVTDGLFGRLIKDSVPGFDMVDVQGRLKRTMSPKPRGETYDKPVVVLTNPRTYSASNYFAQRVVYHKRGVLIGERTGGGAASPEKGSLLVPGVWFQVSTYVVQTPEGKNTEEGIEPDILVKFSSDATAAQIPGSETSALRDATTRDPVLSEALRYLEENR